VSFQLLDTFGDLSLGRLFRFIKDFFIEEEDTSRRRRLIGPTLPKSMSPALKRGRLMRTVRNAQSSHALVSSHRRLQESEPFFRFEINDFASLTFDFNFGDGEKNLLLGFALDFDSGDSASDGYVCNNSF
jgi:hypothetical protein